MANEKAANCSLFNTYHVNSGVNIGGGGDYYYYVYAQFVQSRPNVLSKEVTNWGDGDRIRAVFYLQCEREEVYKAGKVATVSLNYHKLSESGMEHITDLEIYATENINKTPSILLYEAIFINDNRNWKMLSIDGDVLDFDHFQINYRDLELKPSKLKISTHASYLGRWKD